MKKLAIVFLILCASAVAQVTCVAVATAAAGTGSGNSWTNAKAHSTLSGSGFVRGNRYYYADGNYGTTLTVSTATSGTTVIELRKAQPTDFGRTSDGCSNDISTGWNAGTMGAAQAFWQAPSGGGSALFSLGAYVTVNGNGAGVSNDAVGCGGMYATPTTTNVVAPPTPAGCGFKFDDSTCTATGSSACGQDGNGINRTNGTGDIFEWTEHFGNGGRGPSLATVGGSFPNENYWMWLQSVSGNVITHNYFHNTMVTYTLMNGGDSNITIDHNYYWGLYDQTSLHSEAFQVQGTNTNIDIHDNILRDQVTNGDVVIIGASGGNLSGLKFYNNLDYCTNGTSSQDALYGNSCNHTQGMLGCINSGAVCTDFFIYNNTMAQIGGGSGGTFRCGTANSAGGTVTNLNFENNLFYNCGAFQANNSSGTGGTWDYNAYLNSGQAAIGAHDTSSGSSPNPFTSFNATTPDLSIANENALWDTRVSLGSPYDVDILGVTRTTDRGAYQFTSGGQALTPSCSPGTGTYSTTQTVTCTNPNSGTTVMCYSTSTTPVTNGLGTGCTTGTAYTTTISVSSSETLTVIAGTSTLTDSNTISYVYTIAPIVATPTFSPTAGSYIGAINVTISTSTGGATLCYTVDGSTPTANGSGTCTHGTTYSAAVPVTSSETLKAIGSKSGNTDSGVGTAAYIITYPNVYSALPPLVITGSTTAGWVISCPSCVTTAAGVTSFNGRTGAVTLTKGDVTGTGLAATTTATTTLH